MTFAVAALTLLASAMGCHKKLSVPTNHRPVAVVCPANSPSGDTFVRSVPGLTPADFACVSDADCKAAPGGHCGHVVDGIQDDTRCYYDACTRDADCADNSVCACGQGGVSNVCLPGGQTGSCRTDADCSAGEFCSQPDRVPEAGYACHTADDLCGSDADCGGDFCVHEPGVSYWICTGP